MSDPQPEYGLSDRALWIICGVIAVPGLAVLGWGLWRYVLT